MLPRSVKKIIILNYFIIYHLYFKMTSTNENNTNIKTVCENNQNIKTVCINLKSRKDRKNKMKKNNLANFSFYHTTLHKNPKRGCINSHLSVIRDVWKEEDDDFVFIIEDDLKFINQKNLENKNKNHKLRKQKNKFRNLRNNVERKKKNINI